MTTLATEDPTRAHLLSRRFSERSRLVEQRRRLLDIDPGAAPRAHAVLSQVVEETAARLGQIEAELAGEAEVQPNAGDGELTAQEATAMARNRLQHLLMVLERHAPPSCATAAASLRRAIHAELRRLDAAEQPRGRITSCD